MELKNTNFENIKLDEKNNIVYKSFKLKNDAEVKKFDFFKKFIIKFSHSFENTPNVILWTRKEYEAVIATSLIKNSTNVFNFLSYGKNPDKKMNNNFYLEIYNFLRYEINNNFYKISKKILKQNIIYWKPNNNFRLDGNILIDNNLKLWFLIKFKDLNIFNIDEINEDDLYKIYNLSTTIEDNIQRIYNIYFKKQTIKKQTSYLRENYEDKINSLESYNKNLKQYNDDLLKKRIKYSDIQKILGDNLFNQYFGDKNGI